MHRTPEGEAAQEYGPARVRARRAVSVASGSTRASQLLGYVPTPAVTQITGYALLSGWRRMNGQLNRTRLIRDAALATGGSCIACGGDAVAKVGAYPVCERHECTVSAPHSNQRWKRNVRGHSRRIRMRQCGSCGGRNHLTRHHDWPSGARGRPPRPIVVCRRCHATLEKTLAGPAPGSGTEAGRKGRWRTVPAMRILQYEQCASEALQEDLQ